VSPESFVFQGRQPGEQDLPSFALVARKRQGASQDVARRQHAELVAQLTGAAATVEHRHDGVETQPGIDLEARQHARQASASSEAADVEVA
jgi:hypothetical protein